MKVVLSFYFVCLTWVALQKSELAIAGRAILKME